MKAETGIRGMDEFWTVHGLYKRRRDYYMCFGLEIKGDAGGGYQRDTADYVLDRNNLSQDDHVTACIHTFDIMKQASF